MRYWAYFAAKLVCTAGLMYGILVGLNSIWPQPLSLYGFRPPLFGYNLSYTVCAGIWFLFTCGAIYLCVLDQRLRCRVCLRRLRMPVETGSWGSMLQLGRPQVEYICTYGHGSLNIEELQITGIDNPRWRANSNMWDELFASSSKDKDDQRP